MTEIPEGKEPTDRVLIEIQAPRIGYGGEAILRDVDLQVFRGDRLGVVGANGSGKTTLLRAFLGQLELSGGRLRRSDLLRSIAYVPQRHALNPFFPLRARDVVVMGRTGNIGLGKGPKKEDWDAVDDALDRVGLAHRRDHAFAELSGGQQQRVLIARALATGSELLLLDEPTNGMDLAAEYEIMALIDRLNEEEGVTVVLVTHVLSLVAHHCSRLAILKDGNVSVGDRKELLSPNRLEELYGLPVQVREDDGRIFVFVDEGRPS